MTHTAQAPTNPVPTAVLSAGNDGLSIDTRDWPDSDTPRRDLARHEICVDRTIHPRVPADAGLVEMLDPLGFRRFCPTVYGSFSVKGFILQMAALGRELLEQREMQQRGMPTTRPGFSSAALRLIFQQGDRLQEKYGRRFQRISDLQVAPGLRGAVGRDTVLPVFLGRKANSRAPEWGIRDLLNRGLEEAQRVQLTSPDIEDQITLGLYGAAADAPLDPHSLTNDERQCVLLLGLFGHGPALLPNDTVVEQVCSRLARSIERHLDDDTESFNAWFFNDLSNIVKQVSQQRRHGGPVERDVVRRVIQELVFQGFRDVARCLSVAMQAVRDILNVDMNEAEEQHFQKVFIGIPELGGIPLLMLRDQLRLMRCDPLRGSPESLDPGTLLRLLSNHSEMMEVRRHADREQTSRRPSRNVAGGVSRTDTFDHTSAAVFVKASGREHREDADRKDRQEFIEELAADLRKQHTVTCDCDDGGDWTAKVKVETDLYALNHRCRCCGRDAVTPVSDSSIAQFREKYGYD